MYSVFEVFYPIFHLSAEQVATFGEESSFGTATPPPPPPANTEYVGFFVLHKVQENTMKPQLSNMLFIR